MASNPMSSEINETRLELMLKYGLTTATWDSDGIITSASRPAETVVRPASPAPAPGPAAKLAETFAARLKREHDVRFAASHFKPRLDVPQTTDDVPRAVRAREASGGRSSSKQRRR